MQKNKMMGFKRISLIFVLFFLTALALPVMGQVTDDDIFPHILGYYREDGNNTQGRLGNMVLDGSLTSQACKLGNCFDFDGTEDSMHLLNLNIPEGDYTFCSWIDSDLLMTSATKSTVVKWGESSFEVATFDWSDGVDGRWYFVTAGTDPIASSAGKNGWELWCHSFNSSGSRQRLYRNGSQISDTATTSGTLINRNGNRDIYIGQDHINSGRWFNGRLDEILILNRTWTSDLQTYLYNSGGGRVINDAGNFTVRALDSQTNDFINNFNLSVNGTFYTTTTGTVITNIPNTDGSAEVNVDINSTGYLKFNVTGISASGTYIGSLTPSMVLNVTLRDESTSTIITSNSSVELIRFDVAQLNKSSSTGIYNFTLTVPSNYTLRANALGYAQRLFDIEITLPSNNAINLYMINDSTASDIIATVIDQNLRTLEGAVIEVYRYFSDSNSFVKVQTVETNFEGQAALNAVLNDEWYKFRILYQNEEKLFTEATFLFSSTLTLQINTEGTFNTNFEAYRNVDYALNFTNSTQLVAFTWLDNTNTVSRGCLEVYQLIGSGRTLVNSSCVSAASGTIILGGVKSNESFYSADAYIDLPAEPKTLLSSLFFGDTSRVWGQAGLAYYALVQILFIFVFPFSVVAGLAAFPIPMIVAKAAGIITFDWSIVISVAFVCFIMAVIIAYTRNK